MFSMKSKIYFLLVLIVFLVGCATDPKSGAYYKCLSKSKECSEGIPAVRLELMKACKDIYMYTADAKELIDFTNGMC